jgi:hypothetical protein
MDLLATLYWLRDHSGPLMTFAFLLIVVATFWPGRKQRFDREARIPLDDDR